MSILGSFRTEHDAIWRAADRWAGGDMSDRALLESLTELVRVHFRDEEDILFPELRQAGLPRLTPAGEAALGERVAACISEHRQVAALVKKAAAATGIEFRQLLGQTLALVKKHIEKEEDSIFPEAEALLGAQRLRQLQGRRQECSCGGH